MDAITARAEGLASVLEIGPGPGALTQALSTSIGKVLALEVDPKMVRALRVSAPNAEVILADTLQVDLREILKELPSPVGIVSNLPYYITGILLNRIFDQRDYFDRAVLMMQREVAHRVKALPTDGNRGSMSVYAQANFLIETVCEVSATSFLPPPKVNSTVLMFRPKPAAAQANLTPEFYQLVRDGFTQPRKTLVNNLAVAYKLAPAALQKVLIELGIDPKARAHEMSHQDWLNLRAALPA